MHSEVDLGASPAPPESVSRWHANVWFWSRVSPIRLCRHSRLGYRGGMHPPDESMSTQGGAWILTRSARHVARCLFELVRMIVGAAYLTIALVLPVAMLFVYIAGWPRAGWIMLVLGCCGAVVLALKALSSRAGWLSKPLQVARTFELRPSATVVGLLAVLLALIALCPIFIEWFAVDSQARGSELFSRSFLALLSTWILASIFAAILSTRGDR